MLRARPELHPNGGCAEFRDLASGPAHAVVSACRSDPGEPSQRAHLIGCAVLAGVSACHLSESERIAQFLAPVHHRARWTGCINRNPSRWNVGSQAIIGP